MLNNFSIELNNFISKNSEIFKNETRKNAISRLLDKISGSADINIQYLSLIHVNFLERYNENNELKNLGVDIKDFIDFSNYIFSITFEDNEIFKIEGLNKNNEIIFYNFLFANYLLSEHELSDEEWGKIKNILKITETY